MESLQQLTLIVLVVLVSTLVVSQVYATDGFSVYENSDVGVSLEYPSDWEYEEISDPTFGASFYAPFENQSDLYGENFSIAVEPLGIKLTAQEYADISFENMKLLVPDFNLISSQATTFGGKPAQKIVFEIPNLYGLEIKGLSIMTVDDTVGYSLSFFAEKSSYDSYLQLVDTTIDSFSISGISDEPVEIEQFPISEYLTYDDPEKGLTIKYPPNWQKTKFESSEFDVIFQSPLESISDIFAENSLILIKKIPGMSLADYTEVSLNNFESRPGLVGSPQDSPTILSGLPAHQISYTETGEFGVESKAWMVWTVANDSIYVIGFGSTPDAFDVYEPIFQNMLDSVVIEELDLPTPVSGIYSNSEVGLEIKLPEDWEGIEQQKEDLTMVIVSPGVTMQPFAQGSQMSDKLDFSALTLVMGDYSQMLAEISSAVSEETECSSESAQIIEINSMKALEMLSECTDPKLGTVKGLEYVFATKDDAIMAVYVAISKNPGKTYDENIEKFKESLDTLSIKNSLNLSDPFDYASTFDLTASKESVTKNGKKIDVLFASNSTIASVSFDEDNNQLSFEPKGPLNTSGITEVYVGMVLDEPFSVSVGNNSIDDFIVVHDTTTDQTSINFEYDHPSGVVTITNQVKDTEIPDWVRGNADWWAQGAIGDSDFVSGIQYLIKEGIMTIPETAKPASGSDSKEIPSWIKNNADWWAQGLISDDDFVKGIQFLIENGIMEV